MPSTESAAACDRNGRASAGDIPDFFILGAPKCGTTSLYRYLEPNPQIFLCAEKEPGFFCADLPFRNVTTIERYRGLFAGRGDRAQAGEASPWYLYSRVAVPGILRLRDDARFVVMLRNPVELAVSLFFQHRHDGIEPETSFASAWQVQRDAHLADFGPLGHEIPGFPYLDICRLGSQLERLLTLVRPDRVLVLFLDDLAADPGLVVQRVSRFLGVTLCEPMSFPVHNSSRINRSDALAQAWRAATQRGRLYWAVKRSVNAVGLRPGRWLFERLITRETTYDRPPPALIRSMQEQLDPDIALLERLTGRRLDRWRAASAGPSR